MLRGLSFSHLHRFMQPTPGAVRIEIDGQEPITCNNINKLQRATKQCEFKVREPMPQALDEFLSPQTWQEIKEEVERAMLPLAKMRHWMDICTVVQPIGVVLVAVLFFVTFFVPSSTGTPGGQDIQTLAILFWLLLAVPAGAQIYLTGRYNKDLIDVLDALGSQLTTKHGLTFRGDYEGHRVQSGRHVRIAFIEVVPPGAAAQPGCVGAVPGSVPMAAAVPMPTPGAVPMAAATPMSIEMASAVPMAAATPMPMAGAVPMAAATPMPMAGEAPVVVAAMPATGAMNAPVVVAATPMEKV